MGKLFDSCYEWLNKIERECKYGECSIYLTAYRLGYFEASIVKYSGEERLKREEYNQLSRMADDVYKRFMK